MHLMLLVGGVYRLLKSSIEVDDRESAASFFKLFCAQGSALCMVYNNILFLFNVAKCNLGKVNLKAMLASGFVPKRCGGGPWPFRRVTS